MEDEKVIAKLLEHYRHPNIVEVVDTDHEEGIYLRRYHTISLHGLPTSQPRRLMWYQDILCGLVHLHDLGIAHSDLRLDNILHDEAERAVIADFSAASQFGQPTFAPSQPNFPVPIIGLAREISDATDRFALGSLIYTCEYGKGPEMAIVDDGSLSLPPLTAGPKSLDAIIQSAWLGKYDATRQMLLDVESLNICDDLSSRSDQLQLTPRELLRERVLQWRSNREAEHGCILYALPTEDQIHQAQSP
ncbi:uncharacterized protein KY384_009280 [Bacidia gigantensis]|uniref:uncharacterized protein n=1 Tax=Bacidia gigantensis TaxID=2732470 RepID=UPI001D0417DC|nr:uncharacterized protein KY384_009280 [Bacidia gigantensis]KAG8525636.1 hypothetical protein KY384_009280 [Bacidia gigantensis]